MNSIGLMFGLLAAESSGSGGGGGSSPVWTWKQGLFATTDAASTISTVTTVLNDSNNATGVSNTVPPGGSQAPISAMKDEGSSVSRSSVSFHITANFPGGWNLYYSQTGAANSWTTAATGSGSGAVNASFSAVSGRYWVLAFNGGGQAGMTVTMNEFNVS